MNEIEKATYDYCLRLGDSSLILSHRLSEWCGHGPQLEEDIALINVALDFMGLATNLLDYAALIENKNRTADDLAFKRHEREFKNCLITELPNGDYAFTIARQFFYDTFCLYFYEELSNCKDEKLVAIALKAIKEVQYHYRHSHEWMLRLGDGTEESHTRLQDAVNEIWTYTGDIFEVSESDKLLAKQGIAANMESVKANWDKKVKEVLIEATLQMPETQYMQRGSMDGKHTEHLGFLLAEMQYMQRTYPNSIW